MKYFYTEKKHNFGKEQTIIDGDEHNHLANVMRMKAGDMVAILCGDKYEYLHQIVSIEKKKTTLSFIQKFVSPFNPSHDVTVFLGTIKSEGLSRAVTMLNEIGVSEIILFNSSHSNEKINQKQIDKLSAIARQSCKQCFRSIPIKISGAISFAQMIERFPEFKNVVYCSPTATACAKPLEGDVAIIIGPEGGFSEEENDKLSIACRQWKLSNSILRAETAAAVAAGIAISLMEKIDG